MRPSILKFLLGPDVRVAALDLGIPIRRVVALLWRPVELLPRALFGRNGGLIQLRLIRRSLRLTRQLPTTCQLFIFVFCFFSTDAESPHSVPLVLDMTLAHQSSFAYIALPLRIGRVDDLSAIY